MEDRATSEAEAHAELRDRRIEGALDWPHDPFFRPLIGIYSGGRLNCVIPSKRRAYGADARWRCHISQELPDDLPGADIAAICLENGEMLYPPRETRQSAAGARLSVEDIIDAGRRRTRSFDYGGFESFLMLPLFDQLAILYQDYLGHFTDTAGIETYIARIESGKMSILDARDEIATSEEARKRYELLSRDERRGRWCVWGGLGEVLPYLLPAPLLEKGGANATGVSAGWESALRSGFEEIRLPLHITEMLANIALGLDCDDGARRRWIGAHGGAIAKIEARLAASAEKRRKAAPAATRRYALGNLLPAMKTGMAGFRTIGGGVQEKRGATGYIVYGPYMRLEPGRHTLKCTLKSCRPAKEDARIVIEAVYSDILLARHSLLASEIPQSAYEIEFAVPGAQRRLMRDAKFEFRVWTDGGSGVEIHAMSLDVHADDATGATAPSVNNWLALLIPGHAALRNKDGIAARAQSGRVFYGPYCLLLPGAYTFTLELDANDCGDGEILILETVGPEDEVLARQRFKLRTGFNRLGISFDVPHADTFARLAGPLEFRLDKAGQAAFRCTRAELLLES